MEVALCIGQVILRQVEHVQKCHIQELVTPPSLFAEDVDMSPPDPSQEITAPQPGETPAGPVEETSLYKRHRKSTGELKLPTESATESGAV